MSDTPTTEQARGSLAELLCALSFTADIGMGRSMEHGLKTAYMGLELAGSLGLGHEERVAVFYGALTKDAGCTACTALFATFFAGDDVGPKSECFLIEPESIKNAVGWYWRYAPDDAGLPQRIAKLFAFVAACRSGMEDGQVTHCEVGEMFARSLGLPEAVQQAVRYGWERWDGKGLAYGLKGADTPVAARIVHMAQMLEVAHQFGGRPAAEAMAREREGTHFEPELVGAFLKLSEDGSLWQVVELETVQQTVLEMRPRAPFDDISGDDVERVCEVLADFADVKSRVGWNHSRVVADTAQDIARRMELSPADVARVRLAGLVHDLGKAAVPIGILDKGEDLSPSEWERFRLHPYYTERVLERIGPLKDLTPEATAHHERMDGQGYHRQLSGAQIPLGGRILAVADTYATLRMRGGEQREPEAVLKEMRPLVGSHLDGSCYDGLQAALGGAPMSKRSRRSRHPNNLTDREVDVLGLLSGGLSNRDIAKELVISNKTVERHLENIFNKLDISSRTSAAVFAVHHGLVS